MKSFNIRTRLLGLAAAIFISMLILLGFSYTLLNQLDQRLQDQTKLNESMLLLSNGLSNMGQAISYLRDSALTGSAESSATANNLIIEVTNNLESVDAKFQTSKTNDDLATQLANAEEVGTLRDQIKALQTLGIEMASAYQTKGKEAGNEIMFRADGFEARSKNIMNALSENTAAMRSQLGENTDTMQAVGHVAKNLVLGFTLLLGAALSLAMYFISRKLTQSIAQMTNTVNLLANGDYAARCQMKTGDEMQVLGDAFDNLLDERVEQLARVEQENEALNESIIAILTAASKIGEDRDLSVEVPVNEDVSGAVSDAINSMVFEMSSVLQQVDSIADQVSHAANTVDQQANTVNQSSAQDRAAIDNTLKQLEDASEAMNQIARLALACNKVAGVANESTQHGLDAVVSTSEEMNNIRSTIQETAKRIKRLGERSQEISGIVDIINNISERTHVLSLNASIQAASAGEAGRGFSVVADEVQRLAENSRNATAQISKLIQNIQIETSDTIATMDKAIKEVVHGTELAEKAGHQMLETQENTQKLAQAVQKIAANSQAHSELTEKLKRQAADIQKRSVATQSELKAQKQETSKLATYAEQLISTVRLFKLPS